LFVTATIDAILAGAAFSVPDMVVVARRGEISCGRNLACACVATAGLDILFAVVVAMPLFLALRLAFRSSSISQLRTRLASSDDQKAATTTWLIAVGLALLLTWGSGIALATALLTVFRNNRVAVAAWISAVLVVELAFTLILLLVVPTATSRLRSSPRAVALANSRSLRNIAALIVVLGAYGLVAVASHLWFAGSNVAPGYQSLTALLVCAGALLGMPSDRLRQRTCVATFVLACALVVGALLALTEDSMARVTVGRFGMPSGLR
jgi:hypothetical protein